MRRAGSAGPLALLNKAHGPGGLPRNKPGCTSCSGHRISATRSIGIAAGNSGRDLDALLRAADRAAYESMRLGRDRWTMAAGMAVEIAREPASRAA